MKKEIKTKNELMELPAGVELTPTALTVAKKLSFEKWMSLGKMLQTCEKAVQWWIGDYLNSFKHQHGEKYAQAVSPEQADAWKQYAYVARAIEKSIRIDFLTFGHHQTVAALMSEEQSFWLNKANENNWTIRELRDALKHNNTPPLPDGKYRVIYVDPPWKYGDELIDGYGAAEHHYQTMDLDELCTLSVNDLAADNAVLFLWVTSPMLAEATSLIEAWGFEYKTAFIWDKVKHNYGHYNSVRHELLLIATKGSCVPDSNELHDSVVVIEREEHSSKPEYFRTLIDKMYVPKGKDRIELFARGKLPKGWEGWGLQYKEKSGGDKRVFLPEETTA